MPMNKSPIHGNILSTNQARVRGSMDPPEQKRTYLEAKARGKRVRRHLATPQPKLRPVGGQLGSFDHGGRSTGHGSHFLKLVMWRHLIGSQGRSQVPELLQVAEAIPGSLL